MGPGLFRWRAALSAGSLVLAMALLTAVTLLLSPSAGVAAAVSREGRGESFQTEETKEGLSAAVQASTQPPAPSLLPAQAQSKNKTKTPAQLQGSWMSGVWMHPGMFGPKQDEAVSKMKIVLDDYVKAGINTLIMLVKDTSGYVYYQSDLGVKDPAYDWDFSGLF